MNDARMVIIRSISSEEPSRDRVEDRPDADRVVMLKTSRLDRFIARTMLVLATIAGIAIIIAAAILFAAVAIPLAIILGLLGLSALVYFRLRAKFARWQPDRATDHRRENVRVRRGSDTP